MVPTDESVSFLQSLLRGFGRWTEKNFEASFLN